MTRSKKTKFDFGESSENLKKAIDILKPGANLILEKDAEEIEWAETEILIEEIRRVQIVVSAYRLPYFRNAGLSFSAPIRSLDTEELLFLRRLCSEFIPGFRVLSPRRGNPRSALSQDNINLIQFIDGIVSTENINKSRAFLRATKKGNPGCGRSLKEIENAYHRGKKTLEKLKVAAHEATAAASEAKVRQAKQKTDKLGKPIGLLGKPPSKK